MCNVGAARMNRIVAHSQDSSNDRSANERSSNGTVARAEVSGALEPSLLQASLTDLLRAHHRLSVPLFGEAARASSPESSFSPISSLNFQALPSSVQVE